MDSCIIKTALCRRTSILVGLTLLVTATLASVTFARSNIRDAFFSEYPNAVGSALDSVPSHAGHCGVCHYDFSGGGLRNPYGVRLGEVLPGFPGNPSGRRQAIRSIRNEDSDADGFTSLIEVTDETTYTNTPTFPGLTPANVGLVSSVSISDLQPYLVPLTGSDTTPPSVTVISPNGGEVFPGNAAINVQWTATDASGIGSIDIYLSDNDGVSYHLLITGLPSTGIRNVFLPNRPTTVGRIRVRATDNAGNIGYDDSDGPFTITASPAGIAPTTLRDFDMPGTQPFEGGTLNDPSACAACHGNYNPAVEPYYNWQGSMMAHASRDLLFEACLTVANQDAPDSGDLCLRCHIAAGWIRGRSVPTDGTQMLASDKHGVSCDLCHGLVDPIPDPANPVEDAAVLAALTSVPADFANGMFVIDPTGVRRGPFADATLGHPILVSPFHREAALCGTCHDVSNTAFEKDGSGNYPPNAFDTPASQFASHVLMPIERTYSEWFHSEYNTPTGVYAPQFGGNREYVGSCQDCHMRAVTGVGCNMPGAPTRTDLPLHDLTGGSTWLPGLLPVLYPGQVSEPAINTGIARARYMLHNAATMSALQETSQLRVTVTNQSGHKLPTGYPEGRRAWLNVRFQDADEVVIGESGAYDPATGILTHDAELKIYEAKPGLDTDTAGLVGVEPGPSFHFVLNNKIYKDTRIPPRGFTNANFAPFGGTPIGLGYADGQYWDESAYAIPPGAVTAVVTLYYQSTSKEYVEFLRDANTTDTKGQELYDLWSANERCPPEMMVTLSIPLSPWLLIGDIDGDGDIDEIDIQFFVNVLLGLETGEPYVTNSDIDGSGLADGKDIQPLVVALLTP